jgi:hypothetical protein
VRHVGGAAIGLLGTLAGLALMGLGIGRAAYALATFQLGAGRVVGALLLLLGGAVLGGVVVARRLSPAAPLAGGILLLVLSLTELAVPGGWLSYGGRPDSLGYGLSTLIGYQIGIALAGILIVSAFTGSRTAAPRVEPPVYPPWGYTPPR